MELLHSFQFSLLLKEIYGRICNFNDSTTITDKFYNSHWISPLFSRPFFFAVGFTIPLTIGNKIQ